MATVLTGAPLSHRGSQREGLLTPFGPHEENLVSSPTPVLFEEKLKLKKLNLEKNKNNATCRYWVG